MPAKLPVEFYFPTLRSTEGPGRGTCTKHVNEYIATVRDHLRTTLQDAQAQSTAEAQRQKQYYNWKIGTIGLKPGDLILVKADAFQGKRKIKDRWEDKPHEVVSDHDRHPLIWSERLAQKFISYITTCSSSLHQKLAFPCMCMSAKHGTDVPSPTPVKPTPRGSDSKTQEDNGLMITQHQARKISLGWITGIYGFSHGCQLEHLLKMVKIPSNV